MCALVLVVSLFGAGTLWTIEIPGFYNEAHCRAIAGDVKVESQQDDSFFLNVGYTCKKVN